MKLHQSILLIVILAVISGLVACGGGSTTNIGPTNPPPASIAVSVSGPSSAVAGAQQPVTATVTNDTANAGVTWTVTCGTSTVCGSLSSSSSASGTADTFTAPLVTPAGGTVTVTATSVTDATKSGSATITIGARTLADGNYVFSVNGNDSTNQTYAIAGQFVVSGGVITAGEQDFVACCVLGADLINPGGSSTVTTTANGNIQIVLTTCNGLDCTTTDPNIGVAGTETINGTLVSSTGALLTEIDTTDTASGILELQTSTAAPTGGYAFAVSGLNSSGTVGNDIAIGGVINIDSPGVISGAGSVFDVNNVGVAKVNQPFTASSIAGPDAAGRVIFTLNPDVSTGIPGFSLAGYIVDANHIRLVQNSANGTTWGVALAQGANTGTFSTLSGTYVTSMSGLDPNGNAQMAGLITATSGTVSGYISYNDLAVFSAGASPISAGTYTVDATGRVSITGVTDGTFTYSPQFYLDGNGNAMAITVDAGHVMAGEAVLQAAGPFTAGSFAGSYALNVAGAAPSATTEPVLNAVGPVTADGVGAFSGFADLNSNFVVTPALPVSGTYTVDASGLFFNGKLTGLDVTAAANADTFVYYPIDSTKIVAIETDANQLTLGGFVLIQ